jgi:endoglucanase
LSNENEQKNNANTTEPNNNEPNKFDQKTIRILIYSGIVLLLMIAVGIVIIVTNKKDKTTPNTNNSEIILASEEVSEVPETPSEAESESEAVSEEVSEQTTEVVQKAEKKSGKTPFELHGALSVDGNHIVDENGKPFQICGVSTHGLGWFPQYVNQDAVYSLRDDFGANTLRLAMYTAEGEGYCTGGNKENLKKLVTNGVDYCTNAGMYAIIDWHILHDLDPNVYKDEAKAFFSEMSKKYANNKNVIYEICNEPNGGTSWASVKSYAEEIIPIIRAYSPDAIIVVGTPTWSQDVDVAIKDPIKNQKNIVYAVHFYADTHKDNIRNKVKAAEDAGFPVLISEFSICDASGNGNNNVNEANTWIKLLDKYGIGFVAWNLSNKNESSSLISSGCGKIAGWSYDDLSESGKWLVSVFDSHSDQGSNLGKGKAPTVAAQGPANDGQQANPQAPTVKVTAGGGLTVAVTADNTWNESGAVCTQLAVKISNSGTSDKSTWTVKLDMGTSPSVDNIWGAKSSISGNVITLTPESYNSTVTSGGTVSDVGLIVKTAGAVTNISASVQ